MTSDLEKNIEQICKENLNFSERDIKRGISLLKDL
jgi:hypothetical protein